MREITRIGACGDRELVTLPVGDRSTPSAPAADAMSARLDTSNAARPLISDFALSETIYVTRLNIFHIFGSQAQDAIGSTSALDKINRRIFSFVLIMKTRGLNTCRQHRTAGRHLLRLQ